MSRIKTRPQLKEALKKFAEEKPEFTSMQAYEEIFERIGIDRNTKINTNRVAQLLRSVPTHIYLPEKKRWVKK